MKHFCFKRINRIPVILLLLGSVSALFTQPVLARNLQQKLNAANDYFDEAEQARAALEETPASERTARDYEQVIRLYRLVYTTAPTFPKDPKSLIAIGELYETMATNLGGRKYLDSALQAYDLLLQEYPYSRYRPDALFASAKIYQTDLKNPEEARTRLVQLLQKFPRSPSAEQARLAIAQINERIKGAVQEQEAVPIADRGGGNREQKPSDESNAAMADSAKMAEPAAAVAKNEPKQTADGNPSASGSVRTPLKDRVAVTDVREWVTPTSTRIVIYVASDVKYEVGRAENPSRVYVDLYGTKITRELTRAMRQKAPPADGGMVTSLRGAQYQLDVARVVAEVDERADYSVFDLPNPHRLILELRSANDAKQGTGTKEQKVAGPADTEVGAADRAALPSTPVQSKRDGSDLVSAAVDKAPATPVLTAAQPAQDAKTGRKSNRAVAAAPAAANPPAVGRKADSAAKPELSADATIANAKVLPASGDNHSQSAPADADFMVASPTVPPPSTPRVLAQHTDPPVPIRSQISGRLEAMNRLPELSSPVSDQPEPHLATRVKSSSLVAENTHPALPNRDGTRSLTRTLGLKVGRIIIDPGHGGHDTGTIGPSGLFEKDLVLDVALRLGKLLTERLGSDVIYTRLDDTFIPLQTRAAMANEQQADLFLSIHANSSSSRRARGIETYYLSFATDPEALEVAARENAASQESIHELPDLVKKIALNEKVDESKEFATDVQIELHDRLSKEIQQRKDRGVKKAPFMVLVGAKMPAVLAEIAFLSNPQEEKLLKTKQQRQKIAEALYAGVSKYADTLSGVKVAHASNIGDSIVK